MDPNISVQPTQPVTQPIAPPVPEQPAQSKPKFSKWIIAVVVVLLLLIVGGVSAYVLNKVSVKKVLPSPTPVAIVSQMPTATPILDPTANWKAYTGTEYSFKYPLDWKIVTIPPFQVAITNTEAEALNQKQTGDCRSFYPITVSDTTGVGYRLDNTSTQTVTSSPTMVSEINATLYDVDSTLKACGDWNTGKSETIAVNNNGKRYSFILGPSDNTTYKQVFDKVVATFKFAETPLEKPEKATEDFYKAYWYCMQDNPKPSIEQCLNQADFAPVLTSDLKEKLQTVIGADPVLCAQNIPDSINTDTAVIDNNTAKVTVHTAYASSGDNPISVDLTKQNNNWQITSITCNNH